MTPIICVAVVAIIITTELRASFKRDAEREYWDEFVRANNESAWRRQR